MPSRKPIKGNVICPDCEKPLEFELEFSAGLPSGTVPHMYNDGWKETVFCEPCGVRIFIRANAERVFEMGIMGSRG